MAGQSSRGADSLELIREKPEGGLEDYMFNDQTDFDVSVTPGTVKDELDVFNADYCEGKLVIEENEEKKYLTIVREDPEEQMNNLKIKVKFYNLADEELTLDQFETRDARLRCQFRKKAGDKLTWLNLFKQFKEVSPNLLMNTQV